METGFAQSNPGWPSDRTGGRATPSQTKGCKSTFRCAAALAAARETKAGQARVNYCNTIHNQSKHPLVRGTVLSTG
jgi:hypothetical protein